MCDCQNWRSYNFQIRSMEQINWQLIESELSHKNPVMFVEIDGVDGVRVLIDESIWDKANCAGKSRRISRDQQYSYETKKDLEKLAELTNDVDYWGFTDKDNAKEILRVVKRIRKARWDDRHRGMVTVRKIDVSV